MSGNRKRKNKGFRTAADAEFQKRWAHDSPHQGEQLANKWQQNNLCTTKRSQEVT
jgi:hypothetical protein